MYFLSDGPFKTYLVRHSWLLPEGSREDLSYPTSSRALVITPLSWTPVALDCAEVKHRIELQIKSENHYLRLQLSHGLPTLSLNFMHGKTQDLIEPMNKRDV